MTVHCDGDCGMLEQLGERYEFETELTRQGFSHEDFTLHVMRERPPPGKSEWLRLYSVKHALVNNPKTPLPSALRLLPHLTAKDLRVIARSKGVPSALVKAARPEAQFVAMDFSLTMLGGARKAFCRFPPCAKGAKGRGTRPCFHRGPRLRQSTFRSGAGAL